MDVRVASLERTLVDALSRPDLCGGWEEVFRSLSPVEFFDLDEIVRYVLLLDNAVVAAKVGFFLDFRRERLMVEDRHLNPLYDRRPKQPCYMDRRNRKSGRLVSRWNLIAPVEILEGTWSEVL